AQLPADRLVGVLGLAARSRLTHRFGDRAATGAELAHAARLRDRGSRRGGRRRGGRACALRIVGTLARGVLLGTLRCGGALVALVGGGLGVALGLLARCLRAPLGGDALRFGFRAFRRGRVADLRQRPRRGGRQRVGARRRRRLDRRRRRGDRGGSRWRRLGDDRRRRRRRSGQRHRDRRRRRADRR